MNAGLLDHLSEITEEERALLDGSSIDRKSYGTGRTLVVDSCRMLEHGQLIAVRPHTRFAPFPRHAHNYVEIMYMCQGKTVHTINGEIPVTLRRGELLFLNRHADHSIEKAGIEDIAVNFIVLPQFFDAALELIGNDNILGSFLMSGLERSSEAMSYLHFEVSDVLPVQNLMENMVWSLVNREANHRRITQTTMGLLFLQLLNCTEHLALPISSECGNALVLAVLREIEENYSNVTLAETASAQKVSPAYLSRLIHDATGKTYTRLLQEKRLSKAVRLLLGSRLSVQEIIDAVGYDNTSYFHRIFKQEYGVTPREYRKANSNAKSKIRT